jgi:phosphohistidine phosphatase
MQLFFLRHGRADRSAWAGEDAQRPLTPQGRARMQRVARRLVRLGLTVDYIVASPLARAVQTAELVAEALRLTQRLIQDTRLSPGFDGAQLRTLLADYASCNKLMLVGHEPDFSTVISQLTGAGRVVCKKGGLARVDLRSPTVLHGELVWLLPPRVLVL